MLLQPCASPPAGRHSLWEEPYWEIGPLPRQSGGIIIFYMVFFILNMQEKLLIPQFSFHYLQQKVFIPQFVTKTSHSTIGNKNFSVHYSQQKLLIQALIAKNFSFHTLQQKTSHSTICSKNVSFQTLWLKLPIPKSAAKTSH